MTLLQLQVFIAVCQEKSFTKAGEMLNMTQSAVSQAVANLEGELGVQLLVRHRHERYRITVTHIGERVLSHAREIIQHTLDMTQEAAAASGTERGTLRIGALSTVTTGLLPQLLASFRSLHPSVQITLLEGRLDEVGGWLANHMIDVGLTEVPMNNMDMVGLVRDEFQLFVPSNHVLAQRDAVSLERIEDEPYIEWKEYRAPVITDAFRQRGITRSADFEMSAIGTVLEMVRQGMGVTILPELVVPDCIPNVVRVAIAPPIIRDVGLVVRDMKRITPICADFILHAREWVTKRSDLDALEP